MRKLALLVAGLLLVAAPSYIGVASAQKKSAPPDPYGPAMRLFQGAMDSAYKPAAAKADKKAVKKKAKKKAKKAKKAAKKPAKKDDKKKK
jgi:hypothetical protein